MPVSILFTVYKQQQQTKVETKRVTQLNRKSEEKREWEREREREWKAKDLYFHGEYKNQGVYVCMYVTYINISVYVFVCFTLVH